MVGVDVTAATAIVLGALGLLAPAIIAAINRPGWSDQVRRVAALVVSAALAVGGLAVTEGFAGYTWAVLVPAVMGLTQTAYAVLWKPTGAADAIDTATSPKGPEV